MNSENSSNKSGDANLLSQSGTARREAMREELQTEFVQFHFRRRRARRALAWSPAIALVIAATVWWGWPNEAQVNPKNQIVEHRQPAAQDSPVPQPEISVPEPRNSRIEFELINDDQLLDLLAEAGQPSALAWFKGKPVVIPLTNKTTL